MKPGFGGFDSGPNLQPCLFVDVVFYLHVGIVHWIESGHKEGRCFFSRTGVLFGFIWFLWVTNCIISSETVKYTVDVLPFPMEKTTLRDRYWGLRLILNSFCHLLFGIAGVAIPKVCIVYINVYIYIPVVPHKAVAEVSRIGHYTRDWLLWVTDGRAKTQMDWTVQVSRWLIDELTNWLID